MKIDRRTFIKQMNGVLAGVIAMLGFAGCEKESGANYTVRGVVVNKEGGNPIKGIRVGYVGTTMFQMYGTIPTHFASKSRVMTNARGEFVLTDRFTDDEFRMIDNNRTLSVFVDDIENSRYQTEFLHVEFPKGVHTVTVGDVELNEIIVDGS